MSDNGFRDGKEATSDDQRKTYEQQLREDGGSTTLETIFEVLARPRRRFLLYYLHDHTTATAKELARELIAWEEGIPVEAVSDDARDQVATELVHHHLPKLADSTFIEYDARTMTVRYDDPPALLDTVLGFLTNLERDSRRQ